jgi:hypothetical protein
MEGLYFSFNSGASFKLLPPAEPKDHLMWGCYLTPEVRYLCRFGIKNFSSDIQGSHMKAICAGWPSHRTIIDPVCHSHAVLYHYTHTQILIDLVFLFLPEFRLQQVFFFLFSIEKYYPNYPLVLFWWGWMGAVVSFCEVWLK